MSDNEDKRLSKTSVPSRSLVAADLVHVLRVGDLGPLQRQHEALPALVVQRGPVVALFGRILFKKI